MKAIIKVFLRFIRNRVLLPWFIQDHKMAFYFP
ncbi:tryptophanase leader peptide [Suttonella indologenes]|uniref:Uncharacterized protein n=1 Tax=Suttonella indologenes TaxID=13276 RepID=A0A380MKS8_9GAMM|nr:tryptophanase leader peptide [Suttonella indologenes]SUO91599.1 Uncharacterised protein [Suttonella indologenes]